MAKLPTKLETENRKLDHIELAFQSQTVAANAENRFSYEPLLAGHPNKADLKKSFLDSDFNAPFWVSSMTGGTEKAAKINTSLARACNEYGLGMGLGSCRPLLEGKERLSDFDLREIIGNRPFYANLGIAQVEQLLKQNRENEITDLVRLLKVDGLIVHVNPLQEWIQAEGDHILQPPIETIKNLISVLDANIIVKEVGQGMGKESLKALMALPLRAIEFAAYGGTNFSKLEVLRSSGKDVSNLEPLIQIGESAEQMVHSVNDILKEEQIINCSSFIISGGVKNYLDGHYLMEKLQADCIYGQASAFLKHAEISYEALSQYISEQIKGLMIAQAYLKIKD